MTFVSNGVALGCQAATVRRLDGGIQLPAPTGERSRRRGLADSCLCAALKRSFEELGARGSLCQASASGASVWTEARLSAVHELPALPRTAGHLAPGSRQLGLGSPAAAATSVDELRQGADRAEVPRHEILVPDLDPEPGLDQRDESQHVERIEDIGVDQREVVSELLTRAVPLELVDQQVSEALTGVHPNHTLPESALRSILPVDDFGSASINSNESGTM